MTEYTVRLRELHPKQQAIAEALGTHKRIVVRAGRRSGKTTGVARFAVEAFLLGRRVLYAVPVADQLNAFWKEAKRALAEPLQFGVFYKNEVEHIIELTGTDQRIRGKTAWNADTMRGDYADLLILDEWQLMDESAWGEVGAPMLIDNNGSAIFIYTPPSLRSRSLSKARDKQHAAKFRRAAEEDKTGRWACLDFTSFDNPFICEEAVAEVARDMTRLAYKQEILAEDTRDILGALWNEELIDGLRLGEVPKNALPLTRVVVGVDPSGSSTTEAGIVAAGLGRDGHAYVLADRSLFAASPKTWAGAAVALYYGLNADRILGERNYGGDMVETVIRTVDAAVSYRDVNATRGKLVRAEPVCALYEQGRVHHVGVFPDLEEEMCSYVPGEPSPNRMDALVWGLTDLMLGSEVYGVLEYLKGQARLLGA